MVVKESLSVFGILIPPSKVAEMAEVITDRSSIEYQEITWNLLRTVIDDLVRRADSMNLKQIVAELLAENIIRGKGFFCDSCMRYQAMFPEKTIVYAALATLLNSLFPALGSLLVRRLFMQFTVLYKKYDQLMIAVLKFMAHLINFRVMEYVVAPNIVTCCLDKGTLEYVESAVVFLKELNLPKQEFSSAHERFQGLRKHFRGIVRKGQLNQDVLDVIKDFLASWDIRSDRCHSVCPELDWVKKDHRHTHHLHPKYKITMSIFQDNFKPDSLFLAREIAYETFKRLVLLEGYWILNVQKNSNHEWRKYIRAPWSDDYPESSGNQLLQSIQHGGEMQLCLVLLEECFTSDLVSKHVRLAEYLCRNNQSFRASLSKCFLLVWLMIPGLLGMDYNASEFFAELLINDSLSWHVLAYVQLMPQDRTADHSDFLKNLFLLLKIRLTTRVLLERLLDPSLKDVIQALFQLDDPVDAETARKFFKKIGLGQVARGIMKSRFLLVH